MKWSSLALWLPPVLYLVSVGNFLYMQFLHLMLICAFALCLQESRKDHPGKTETAYNLPIIVYIFLMWIILKTFIESASTLLLFYALVFWPRGMWHLISWTRDWTPLPTPPATSYIRRWCLNHWECLNFPGLPGKSHTLLIIKEQPFQCSKYISYNAISFW